MGNTDIVADAGASQFGADIGMTLASITYCADIAGAISTFASGWTLAWLPDKDINGNYAFIARSDDGGLYAVAIRGSLLNFSWAAFDNWFEQDFNVFEQVDWQYPADPANQPKISKGSSDGLDDLTSLVQTDSNGQTTTLFEFLLANAVGPGKSIAVVGHSLGGSLATVLAPWLHYQIGQAGQTPPPFSVYTFAAPPAGNEAFVSAYDALFANSWRYFNVLDIVPMASVPLSIIGMGLLYLPEPQAGQISVTYEGHTVTLSEAFDAIAVLIGSSEIANDFSFYSQTNLARGSVPLNPDASFCKPDQTEPLVEQWFWKAGCEHVHNTYLQLLGAPQVTCTQVSFTP